MRIISPKLNLWLSELLEKRVEVKAKEDPAPIGEFSDLRGFQEKIDIIIERMGDSEIHLSVEKMEILFRGLFPNACSLDSFTDRFICGFLIGRTTQVTIRGREQSAKIAKLQEEKAGLNKRADDLKKILPLIGKISLEPKASN